MLTVTVLGAHASTTSTQFMENLEATGAFRELRSTQERTNEDDQIEAVLEMIYCRSRPEPGHASTAATGAR